MAISTLPKQNYMIDKKHFKRDLSLIRAERPLVHNITNYVVMNNTANALLAIGASPVMIHAVEEAADMAVVATSLVLNIGTIDHSWLKGMLVAGKVARANNKPMVLDLVGAGATPFRSTVCHQIIEECRPTIIRGNASEIISLVRIGASPRGVDSVANSDDALASAKTLVEQTGAIVVIPWKAWWNRRLKEGSLPYNSVRRTPQPGNFSIYPCASKTFWREPAFP
jgi:hydroxyethylthiazole kinase